MLGHVGRMVVINGAALVFGIDILCHHFLQPRRAIQPQFTTQKPIFKIIHEIALPLHVLCIAARAPPILVEMNHRRVVFKIMIGIKTHAPRRLLPITSHEPCPQMITFFVGKRAIGGIAPCRKKGMPKCTGRGTVVHNLHTTILLQIGCSAKLRGHFQSQFHRKGHLSFGVSNHHIARFAVVKRTLRVAMLPLGETLLPATVGGFAISHMPFQAQPAVGEGHYPITRQRKAHLRNRPCIDA